MYRLKSRIDLISARRAYSAAFSSQSLKILVCAGTGCVAGGSLDIYARLKELIDEKGLYCQVELDHEHHSHGHDGCDSSNVKTVGLKKERLPRLLRDGSPRAHRTLWLPLHQGKA